MQYGPAIERTSVPVKGIAARLWSAARSEFSLRGYHGARVQGIARRAGCNVALLYRHWASKKALYLDVLGSVWSGNHAAMLELLQKGMGAPGVVAAYLDSHMADPEGAQILVREYLDGAPFLSQIFASDPSAMEPVKQAVEALGSGNGLGLRPGIDPLMAALVIAGLAALAASSQEDTRPFFEVRPSRGDWRKHLTDLLLHGLVRPGDGTPR